MDVKDAAKLHAYLLLDTSILIDEFKRATNVLAVVPVGARRTSVVAVWEFLDGIRREERVQRDKWLDEHRIVLVGFSRQIVGPSRNLFRLPASPPGPGDFLLAADCVARRWPLVTRNKRDFEAVPNLRLVPV